MSSGNTISMWMISRVTMDDTGFTYAVPCNIYDDKNDAIRALIQQTITFLKDNKDIYHEDEEDHDMYSYTDFESGDFDGAVSKLPIMQMLKGVQLPSGKNRLDIKNTEFAIDCSELKAYAQSKSLEFDALKTHFDTVVIGDDERKLVK